MTGVEIRRVRTGDEAEWRRLWTAYLRFYETALPEPVYRAAWRRLLDDDPHNFHGLVADSGAGLAGLVHYVFHPHMWRVEGTCYLQDLYVDPDRRGTGLGRRLIEAVYQAADAAGCPSVYWLTQDFNHAARKLYDRVGKLTPFIKYQRG